MSQQLTLTEKTNGTLEVEIKYVNPNENTDSLSSKLFGAENSHTFKQRNLKETQDFGRGSQVTPEEGRYPSPIAQHCAVALLWPCLRSACLCEQWKRGGTSQAGTPQLLPRDTSRAGPERLT